MKKDDETFTENLIKGRIAETIVEQLFKVSEYEVFRFGMESALPAITGRLTKNNKLSGKQASINTPVTKKIRFMPDFIMKEDDNVFFVEAKFRANGKLAISDLTEQYPYKDAYIILISPKSIKCISVTELEEHTITECDNRHLHNHDVFKNKIKENVVKKHLQIAQKFYLTKET